MRFVKSPSRFPVIVVLCDKGAAQRTLVYLQCFVKCAARWMVVSLHHHQKEYCKSVFLFWFLCIYFISFRAKLEYFQSKNFLAFYAKNTSVTKGTMVETSIDLTGGSTRGLVERARQSGLCVGHCATLGGRVEPTRTTVLTTSVCSGVGHNKPAGALSGAGRGFGPRVSKALKDSSEAKNARERKYGKKV